MAEYWVATKEMRQHTHTFGDAFIRFFRALSTIVFLGVSGIGNCVGVGGMRVKRFSYSLTNTSYSHPPILALASASTLTSYPHPLIMLVDCQLDKPYEKISIKHIYEVALFKHFINRSRSSDANHCNSLLLFKISQYISEFFLDNSADIKNNEYYYYYSTHDHVQQLFNYHRNLTENIDNKFVTF